MSFDCRYWAAAATSDSEVRPTGLANVLDVLKLMMPLVIECELIAEPVCTCSVESVPSVVVD